MNVRGVVLAVSLLGSAAVAEDQLVPPHNLKSLTPEAMTDRVRHTLKKKMKDHGREMKSLPMAVVMLDYKKVGEAATRLANEPRIDKAAADEGAELAGLTDGFFYLQDQLRAKASDLKAAAAAKDPKGVAQGLGQVADVCATCHAVYRQTPSGT